MVSTRPIEPYHFMFNHTKLVKKPKQFLSITGLTVSQFDFLSKEIKKNYKTTEQKCLSTKKRDRERLVQDTN